VGNGEEGEEGEEGGGGEEECENTLSGVAAIRVSSANRASILHDVCHRMPTTFSTRHS